MYFVGVPLLIVPFALYNIFAFIIPGVSWNTPLFSVALRSGAQWPVSPGDIMIAFAILILLVELVKLTRLGLRTWVDHLLSFALLAGMTAEFVLVQAVATPTFFLLLVISFVDFVGGVASALAARARRRQIVFEQTPPPMSRAASAEPKLEVRSEPKPAPGPEPAPKPAPEIKAEPEPASPSAPVKPEPSI
jgi:hypothetical protein